MIKNWVSVLNQSILCLVHYISIITNSQIRIHLFHLITNIVPIRISTSTFPYPPPHQILHPHHHHKNRTVIIKPWMSLSNKRAWEKVNSDTTQHSSSLTPFYLSYSFIFRWTQNTIPSKQREILERERKCFFRERN